MRVVFSIKVRCHIRQCLGGNEVSPIFFRWLAIVVAAGGLGTSLPREATAAESPRVFRAGAATGNITPELGSRVIRGSIASTTAIYVHDELHVRSLVLDDGTTRLAIAICDNMGLPREVCDEAKRMVEEEAGIPPSRIIVAATHSHSAGDVRSFRPNYDEQNAEAPKLEKLTAYERFVARRVGDAVRNAIQNLQPARIGWGVGSEPGQVFNRRWTVRSEAHRANPFGGVDPVRTGPPVDSDLIEPVSPTDPQIWFISVQSRSGRPIALLANYSLHYIGGVGSGHISADYFGVFAERIREMLGAGGGEPAFVGILSNGTSGDITNINYRNPGPRRPPYEQMRTVANIVAAEVYRSYQTIEHHEWVPLDFRYAELPLRPRKPTPEQIRSARQVLARPAGAPTRHPREIPYAQRTLEMALTPETLNIPVQVFRIGELAISTIPAEAFVEIGLEIKKRSPFPATFTIGLANGYYGYLPTVEQHALGGYETWLGTSRIENAAAPTIVEAVAGMLREMRNPAGK